MIWGKRKFFTDISRSRFLTFRLNYILKFVTTAREPSKLRVIATEPFSDCLFKCTGFFLAPHCQTSLLTIIENNRRKLHFWSTIKVKFIHVAECMGIMYKQKYCELRTNIALSKMCGNKDVHTFVELF